MLHQRNLPPDDGRPLESEASSSGGAPKILALGSCSALLDGMLITLGLACRSPDSRVPDPKCSIG